MHMGFAPSMASSRAHSNGMSPSPTPRAAAAGNSAVKSSVAVEDDAHDVVVLEIVAGEELLDQALGLLLDLLLGVLVARDRAAQRPNPHTQRH